MSRPLNFLRLAACAAATTIASEAVHGAFVQFVVTASNTSFSGQNLVVYNVYARFNGPTDTLLNVYNVGPVGGSSFTGFWHKDNASYNSGVLSQEFGTWNPGLTGSVTANRPYDSYVTVGSIANSTNSTSADPGWSQGGNADARSWNRPDVPTNGGVGWFNANPPSLQGRVGVNVNTATDVRIGQFVLSPGHGLQTFVATIGYNTGVAGSGALFSTAQFTLGGDCPALYRDADGDGFGAAGSTPLFSCAAIAGYVANDGDCNDAAPAINPNAVEVCDGIDNNCNNQIDDGAAGGVTYYRDADADTFGNPLVTTTGCSGGPPSGYVSNSGDCNDGSAAVYPGAPELCANDGTDNDCDGEANSDTEATDATNYYADADSDGFGAGAATKSCTVLTGFVANDTDCNDTNAAINPNTVWYRDTDADGFGSSGDGTLVQCLQPTGYVLVGNDNCPAIANPGQQDCDASGVGDACEIASGALLDCDNDGIADACEGATVVRRSSPLLAPFGSGAPVSFSFTNLVKAYGPSARLRIEAISDLDLSNEFIAVSFDGGAQEFFFVATGSDCPATADSETKVFTIPAFNALAADGTLNVSIVASGTVNPAQCAGGGLRLFLEYAGLPATSDCNNNGQLDSCEIANGLAADCNGNGILDACDVTNGLGTDCNANGRLDSCDLASGLSTDLNSNGVLDDCAGEFVVGGSGYASIQAAITAVGAGGTIQVASGLYTGPISITGKPVNLTSLTGATETTISGAGLGDAIVRVDGAAASGTRIAGFTFRDGTVGLDFGGNRVGGAIAVTSVPNVTIEQCRFYDNGSSYGGAVYCFGGAGRVLNCIFSGNSATIDGGALQLGASTGNGWEVRGCTFRDNQSGVGGAMHVWSLGCAIYDSTFVDNTATSMGGALSWFSQGSTGVLLDGCIVEQNTAGSGGGIAVIQGTGSFGLIRNRFCRNLPENVLGGFVDLGSNIFSQDCDADGICDYEEIADASSTSFVWSTSEGGNGKRYIRVSSELGWDAAQIRALAIGGHLAAVTTSAEQAFLVSKFGSLNSWIGGFQQKGTAEPAAGWEWVTGEPWNYTAWFLGEPNDQNGEDRLQMSPGGLWNDSGCPGSCDYELGFIIEIDDALIVRNQDCNGNGVPDGCDLDSGLALDCNGNGRPDSCDIAAGTLVDCNGNGVADDCELGDTIAWGENNTGQSAPPSAVDRASMVSAGCNHGLAVNQDGSVLAWGSNSFGQRNVPAGTTDVRQIAAGCDHSLAVQGNGTVVAWGYNAFSQCNVPASANGSVAQLAAGANHSGVRKTDGSLVLWGRNLDGECNKPVTLGPVTNLALGGAHSVGLRGDGTVACWGLNNFGQSNVPAGVGTLQSIAAGCYHTVGLRSNGTVVAWGSTLFGQTTVPAGLSNVVAVSAGSGQHTLALRSDGSVVAWGWNAFGQTNVPSNAVGIAEIAAGGTYSIARRSSALDCNANGAIDSCEIANGTQTDCNANGKPDSCDLIAGTPDCNGNGLPDSCDIASGIASDCNANNQLDACELASGSAFDCNGNGRLDVCDIAMGMGSDCNGNGKLDTCDLAAGTSTDLNGNGILDECPGEFVVGGSGFATIQAAVSAAPTGTQIDVGPGTYTGAISLTTKPIKLKSTAGAAQTILSGTGLDASIITIRSAAANGTVIDGFTLRDGPVGTAEFGTRLGGAIVCIQTRADILNCRFLNNSAAYGGAIYAYDLSGNIHDCVFEGNHGTVGPGAVQVGFGGTVDLAGNQYLSNTAGMDGGAVAVVQWFEGPVTIATIRNSTFRGNSAVRYGGALVWYAGPGGDLAISGCTVESNTSTGSVFARAAESASATFRFAIENSRFCLNNGGNVDAPLLDKGGNTFSQDCNGNGICDADEIAAKSVADCDRDGFPDSCQLSRAVAWGENANGQSTVPAALGAALKVSAGCNHALAIRNDGTLAAWGSNSFGQLSAPSGLGTLAQIAAGCDHSLALSTGGTLHAWGYNAFNQCNIPSAANGGIAQIAAGANHSGVRKSDGSLVLWGRNIDGECNVPASLGPVATFALGGAHSVGLRANGTVACWGLNNFGQTNVPADVGTLRAVAAGCYHTVGLRTNGTVRAWGSTLFGQTTVPAGLTGVIDIAAGSGQHTLALKSDGSVVAWGWNAFGQTTVPSGLSGVAQVSAGGTFSLVRTQGADDCNDNGAIDACEIASNPAIDCNGNGRPDSCDLASGSTDCDNNGRLDSCDIAAGAADCNGNGKPDSCDILAETSTDLNGNGVPDECPGEWVVGGTGFATIPAAISAAPNGTTIRVGPGTYSAPVLLNNKSVKLVSIAGAEQTILSGAGLTTSIIAVRTSAANGFVIDGFTFRDGTVGSAAFDTRVGGGLFLDNVSGDVRNCRFIDNASNFGGGLYAISFTGAIEDCYFEGNEAVQNSGGAQLGFGGTVDFRRNTMVGNTAQNGGALHVVNWDNGPLTSVSLTECVFRNNTATLEGGALLWYGATGSDLPVVGCTVESNTAPDAAFTRIGGTLAFRFQGTRFCLNEPANVIGAIVDLGGNTFSQDCNRNGICDADEILSLSESDCNANGIPDSCELSGNIIAFGDAGLGQLNVPAGIGRPMAIATGCDHSLALKANGTVLAWGQNTFGQATVPSDLPTVQDIVAGCDHNLALTTSGTVRAWGYNGFGQCNVPTISGTVVQISAGANHSGVRRADGSLLLWGRNIDGECNVPAALGPAAQLALGGAHSVGRRSNGTVVAWGLNNFGQCNTPANVGTLQSIAAGCYHTVGLRTNGTVVVWGSSLFGQTSLPGGLNNVVAIAAGSGQHTLALKSNGTVVAWGWNAFGQSSVPANAVDVIKIAAGGTHSMVHTRPVADCNGNNQIDSCEIANGSGSDCNLNGVLDSCELASGSAVDCNSNGRIDSCEIADGSAADCNTNSVLDTCELAAGTAVDCNLNSRIDSCEIADGTAADCNGNSRLDVCDLTAGTSTDLNGNLVPDECAGEFVVGGTGYQSIQAAINGVPDGVVIQVSPGTWPAFQINGRSLTIRSIGGSGVTFVDGGGSQRAALLSNISLLGVRLEGLTFRNGVAADGAGIKLVQASPAIVDCVIENNVASAEGGGIFCASGAPQVADCIIRNNAARRGGGLWIAGIAQGGGSALFNRCQFLFNDAIEDGAGICNTGQLQLIDCDVLSNLAGTAGGGLQTIGTSAASSIDRTFFCLNLPDNTSGTFTDIGGNTFGDDCNSNGICDVDEIAAGAEDKNQNGQLDTCELARGDLNLDEVVNASDLAVLLNFWGATNPPAGDLNGDNIITAADLAVMLNNWGGG